MCTDNYKSENNLVSAIVLLIVCVRRSIFSVSINKSICSGLSVVSHPVWKVYDDLSDS